MMTIRVYWYMGNEHAFNSRVLREQLIIVIGQQKNFSGNRDSEQRSILHSCYLSSYDGGVVPRVVILQHVCVCVCVCVCVT